MTNFIKMNQSNDPYYKNYEIFCYVCYSKYYCNKCGEKYSLNECKCNHDIPAENVKYCGLCGCKHKSRTDY